MSFVRSLFAGAVGVVLSVSVAQAAPQAYSLDPSHSTVAFVLDHMGYAKMLGRFNSVAGDIQFDKDAVEKSSVKVTIDAASVDTNHAKRDEHLRSPDFFNAKEFPKLTFISTVIEKTGDKSGRMTGTLTLLGVSKPVVLDVTFNKDANSPVSKKDTVGFSARGTLKRSDFGMKYGVPAIGDDVTLMIEVEAVK